MRIKLLNKLIKRVEFKRNVMMAYKTMPGTLGHEVLVLNIRLCDFKITVLDALKGGSHG